MNSWVLSPEELIFGEGTYYFMILQDMGMDSTAYNGLTINVTCFASHCVFWDEHQGGWNSHGCHVSRAKQNNVSVTHFKASPHNHHLQ